MQIRCDQMQERAWAKRSRDDAHLFKYPVSCCPTQVALAVAAALAVGKAAVEGEEEGKAGSSSSQPLITGASLAPLRIKTSVRGLVKQQQANATEWQATLKNP